MDSRKSIGGESLRESLYSCTFIINVSHNFYENLFGFSQNLLGENRFSDSRRISSPGLEGLNVEIPTDMILMISDDEISVIIPIIMANMISFNFYHT